MPNSSDMDVLDSEAAGLWASDEGGGRVDEDCGVVIRIGSKFVGTKSFTRAGTRRACPREPITSGEGKRMRAGDGSAGGGDGGISTSIAT